MLIYSLLAAVTLVLTHVFSEKLKFDYLPRSKWLSFSGGVSVSYVFVHIFPELAEGQEILHEEVGDLLKYEIYLVAMFGLAVFYGLERAAKQSADSERASQNNEITETGKGVYQLHIVSFGLYNAIIGYLLVSKDEMVGLNLIFFTLAMAFHFVVNDYAFVEHYKSRYRRTGRWILAGSILLGWLIGFIGDLHKLLIILLFAFVAGGTILNTLKEELPQDRKSNFWAFGAGLLFYAALLVLV